MDSNDDLQASHHILRTFENAKSYNDQILDSLPGFYAVFSKSGEILRANQGLADILGLNFETLHLYNIVQILTEGESRILQDKMRELKSAIYSGVNFEMSLGLGLNKKKSYLFYLKAEKFEHQQTIRFFTLIGQDVSEVKDVVAQNSRMQSELNMAQEVQNALFPEGGARFDGASVVGHYVSATECSGDWWFYNKIGKNVFLWIGDVTGHGVASALVVAAVRTAVSFLENEKDLKPSKALIKLNEAVLSVSKGQKFMSFFVASINPKSGECWYALAGHPEPVIAHELNGQSYVNNLERSPTHLLGSQKHVEFEDQFVQLKKGDFLIAFTDGLYEVVNAANAEFGYGRFHRAIGDAVRGGPNNPQDLQDKIISAVTDYRKNAPLKDDQTMIVFHKD